MAARTLVFRIYPERGSRYVRVKVWPTMREMHAYFRQRGLSCVRARGSLLIATCRGFRKGLAIAEVNFQRGDLTTATLTHEFLHATVTFVERLRLDWRRDEERIAEWHARTCHSFVERAYAAKLYTQPST